MLDHPLDAPGRRIAAVRFSGERAVELRTTDGRLWTVALDPGAVRTSHTLHTCADDGGLCRTPVP